MGETSFSFRGSRLSLYRVNVGATSVSVVHDVQTRRAVTRTREVAFAEVEEAALHEVKLRRGVSEGLFLRTGAGTVGFAANSSGDAGATEEDMRACNAAEAAVMSALAAVKPDVKVRLGPTRQAKVMTTLVLLLMGAALSTLFVVLAGGGYVVVGVIFVVMLMQAVFQFGVLKKPVFVTPGEAVSRLIGKSVWGVAKPAGR